MKFRAGSNFLYHAWGREVGVYGLHSGDTHLLDPLGCEILQTLSAEAHTYEELVTYLEKQLSGEELSNIQEYLQKLLQEFERRGLIESVTP